MNVRALIILAASQTNLNQPMKSMLPKSHSKAVAMLARVAILIVATAFLAGCGSKPSNQKQT
jgi:hypothetical protein